MGAVVLVVVVRSRAKRSDRKRDAKDAAERRARKGDDGPSLY